MESDALDGWWWLPSHPDDAVFGRLLTGPSGPWKLDVYGSLSAPAGPACMFPIPGLSIRDEFATSPVIHGHLLQGAPGPRSVSLIDCQQRGANQTFGGAANGERTESWAFEEVVTGHENVAGDEGVVAIRLRLSNLLEWSGRSRPRVVWSNDTASVAVASRDLGSAEIPGATIDLVLDHGATESATDATLRHRAMFRVTPHEPVSFRSAMSDYALPLKALLTFLTLGHVDVDSLDGALEPHQDDRRRPWFNYRTRLQRPFDEPKPPRRYEMLATWPDLAEMTVDGLVGGWFKLRRDRHIEKTITYLLIPHHAPYLYTDDHLMTAFVAMEAYHRARFDAAVLDRREFQQRVDVVVASAPDEYRDWARRLLKDRNQKGQTTKLREVVERSGATGEALVTACPQFVKLAIASRNTVAHPGPSGREPGATYLALSYGLRWMLRHCLLVDLGLAEDQTAEVINACTRFGDERELIQRWTSGL